MKPYVPLLSTTSRPSRQTPESPLTALCPKSTVRFPDRRLPQLPGMLLALFLSVPAIGQSHPTISKQPLGGSRSLGDQYTLRVSVVGEPPFTYQWRHDKIALPNATNSVLTLTNLTLALGGEYAVTVANANGSIISDSAILDVDATFTRITTGPVATDFGFWPSWADYDGDGWIDLLIPNSNRLNLYHNERDGTFSRVPATNGIVRTSFTPDNINGGVWADYDNDGDLDLFAPTGGGDSADNDFLFRNDGGGMFTRITTGPIVHTPAASVSACWGDYDRDGWVDLFVANYGPGSPQTDVLPFLWHNRADGTFERVMMDPFDTIEARHFSSSWTDVNGDGWPDIGVGVIIGGLVIFENQSGKGFERLSISDTAGAHIGGPAWADFDNDGDMDALVSYSFNTSFALLKNDGAGNLERVESGDLTTLPARTSGGVAWGDYDNDGWLDLFAPRTSFYSNDGDSINHLWHNNGDGTFTRVERGSPATDNDQSWGAAWGDYDNDGFLDLVVGQWGGTEKNRLYRNNGNSNAWLTFRIVGTRSNRAAIGAKVRLRATIHGQTVTQLREISGGNGAAQQNDLRAHFGLGDAKQADEVRVEWPSGQVTELKNVASKQFLTITEPGGAPRLQAVWSNGSLRFTLTGDPNETYRLDQSRDLRTWQPFSGEAPDQTDASGISTFDWKPSDASGASFFLRALKR